MYDELAENFHLMFEDWNASVARQAGILGPLIERATGCSPARVLDCACGIGTQALGLAMRGHCVVASDVSASAVERARHEARQRALELTFYVADMRDLAAIPESGFDAVLAADNALPHLLTDEDLERAGRSALGKLRPGGVFCATIRDYDRLVTGRPPVQGPAFFRDGARRRIVHQVWDWTDERTYTLHVYITRETDGGWDSLHYVSVYRAVLRSELSSIFERAGFADVRWLIPEESGFYQPVMIGRTTARR